LSNTAALLDAFPDEGQWHNDVENVMHAEMEGSDADVDDAEWEAAAMERAMERASERAAARMHRMALLEEDKVGLWDPVVPTRGA
jgi:hypothetical protein